MKAFSEIKNIEDVIKYQKQILSRTGGRNSNDARIFHYTNIDAFLKIINSGYIWLSPPDKMNDVLERQLIQLYGTNDLFLSCFSRTNQNIAMFKMYAPEPNGIMLSITISDAKAMISQKPLLVEKDELTKDEIDVSLYWIGVCYKDLNSDIITTPSQKNRYISNPLKSLAGAVKLSGWEYEKEVRLCARKRLFPGQKLAVRLPQKIDVVLCPFFDKEKNKEKLAELIACGINYEVSPYEAWINRDKY